MNHQSRAEALAVLGLSGIVTKEEIRKTFHRLASMYHPDANNDPNAKDYYVCIQSAYEYLMALPEETIEYHGNVAVARPLEEYYGAQADHAGPANAYGASANTYGPQMSGNVYYGGSVADGGARIIGSRESLSMAATRRAFKEEHRKQEQRLKQREEQRKKEAGERYERERRQRIFEEAMARIHAIRAAEVTANIIQDVLKNGSRSEN
ncbi:MAG: DnaJ domain-containing protein [Lachnospiraceae bacterium]|nr:DnaJ domain-containing protein [Lachnospiraceae bacterium]